MVARSCQLYGGIIFLRLGSPEGVATPRITEGIRKTPPQQTDKDQTWPPPNKRTGGACAAKGAELFPNFGFAIFSSKSVRVFWGVCLVDFVTICHCRLGSRRGGDRVLVVNRTQPRKAKCQRVNLLQGERNLCSCWRKENNRSCRHFSKFSKKTSNIFSFLFSWNLFRNNLFE